VEESSLEKGGHYFFDVSTPSLPLPPPSQKIQEEEEEEEKKMNGKTKGEIKVIAGCMFSGKSNELMNRISRASIISGIKILLLISGRDTRNNTEFIQTHDGNRKLLQIPRISCLTVSEGIDKYIKQNTCLPNMVAIDEGQFFPDLVESSEILANKGILVIIAMLDGKADRTPWIGNECGPGIENNRPITDIYSIADNYIKLYASCSYCGNDAPYSKLKCSESSQQGVVLIGGSEKYVAVCRRCYFR